MEWEPIQLSLSLDSLGSSSVTSSVTFNASSAGGVMLVKTSGLPLTVNPDPTPTPSSTSEPAPAPTVTVTQTVAPPGPSEVSGTVKLDDLQFLGLTTGLVLLLLFLSALLAAQLRRP